MTDKPLANVLDINLGKTVFPLLGFSENDKLQLVGTSVLVRHGKLGFLLTAAHVLDNWGKKPILIAPRGGNPIEITIPACKTSSKGVKQSDDITDLAYFNLNNDFGDNFFGLDSIPFHDPDITKINSHSTQLYAFGYPSSKLFIDFKESIIDCPPLQYFGNEVTDAKIMKMCTAVSSHHRLISFKKDKCYNPRINGYVHAPDPYGASGGLLATAHLDENKALTMLVFEGILTEWHQENAQILKATSKDKVLDFICNTLHKYPIPIDTTKFIW